MQRIMITYFKLFIIMTGALFSICIDFDPSKLHLSRTIVAIYMIRYHMVGTRTETSQFLFRDLRTPPSKIVSFARKPALRQALLSLYR